MNKCLNSSTSLSLCYTVLCLNDVVFMSLPGYAALSHSGTPIEILRLFLLRWELVQDEEDKMKEY